MCVYVQLRLLLVGDNVLLRNPDMTEVSRIKIFVEGINGWLVSLFNGISTFMSYLIPKTSLQKKSSGSI